MSGKTGRSEATKNAFFLFAFFRDWTQGCLCGCAWRDNLQIAWSNNCKPQISWQAQPHSGSTKETLTVPPSPLRIMSENTIAFGGWIARGLRKIRIAFHCGLQKDCEGKAGCSSAFSFMDDITLPDRWYQWTHGLTGDYGFSYTHAHMHCPCIADVSAHTHTCIAHVLHMYLHTRTHVLPMHCGFITDYIYHTHYLLLSHTLLFHTLIYYYFIHIKYCQNAENIIISFTLSIF